MLSVYNTILDQEHNPAKMKNGLITLIPKGGTSSSLDNFRGITLNNVDLKILSKMLHFRICPYLEDSIHASQFSTPGKKEWELNNLIRDIYNEMSDDTTNDGFFVRVDFRKAFDSVNQDFYTRSWPKWDFPLN